MGKHWFVWFFTYSLIGCCVLSCAQKGEKAEKPKGLKDIERAITAIEDRRQAELRIIKEQQEQIDILEVNIEKANAEGMKQELRRQIELKRVVLRKAENNLQNQDKILKTLHHQRDSLKQVPTP